MPPARIPACPEARHVKPGMAATSGATKKSPTRAQSPLAPCCHTRGVSCPAVPGAGSQRGLEKRSFLPLKTQTREKKKPNKNPQTAPGEGQPVRGSPTQPAAHPERPRRPGRPIFKLI